MHEAHAGDGPALWAIRALIALLTIGYLFGAHRHRGWSAWRAASLASGMALLLVALSPVVVDWAHRDLRGHMAQHLLLGMFAPLLIVLAAPMTLLLTLLPTAAARRLVALLQRWPIRVLCHPITAALLNIGGMAVLYGTTLYALSRESPWLHALVHYHFVAAGYLWCWSIAGPDPARDRPSLRARGVVLLLGTAAHAVLGKWMYAHGWPQGTGAPRAEIEVAAQWMYYGGDIAGLLLIAAWMSRWPPTAVVDAERSHAPPTGSID